ADKLARLQDGALLINAARAAIIDKCALYSELQSGRIRAVLDVFHEEPLPVDDPIRQMENVLLIPHMAGSPTRSLMTATVIDDLERFLADQQLENAIPLEYFQKMTRNDA